MDSGPGRLDKILWIALEPTWSAAAPNSVLNLKCLVRLSKCFRNERNIIRYVEGHGHEGEGSATSESHPKVITVIREPDWLAGSGR